MERKSDLRLIESIVAKQREEAAASIKRYSEQKRRLAERKRLQQEDEKQTCNSDTASDTSSVTDACKTMELHKRTGKPYGVNYTFFCVSCNAFAFKSIQVFRVHPRAQVHVALDPSIYERTKAWPYPDDDGLEMVVAEEQHYTRHLKICCDLCGHQWGNASYNKHGSLLPFIKLTCFTLVDPDGKGNSYNYWKDVPIKWPVLNSDEELRYMSKVRFMSFQSAYDLKGKIACSGTVIRSNSSEVTLVATRNAVPSDCCVTVQADTKAHMSYIDENLKTQETNEDAVTSAVQFYCTGVGGGTFVFNKHVCVRIKHNAKRPSEIKVYRCEHRESSFFDEIQRFNYTKYMDGNEDYFVADKKIVYIFTKQLKSYICTEKDTAKRKKTPDRTTLALFTAQHQGIVAMEIYAADLSLSRQHYKNFLDSQKRRGFEHFSEEEAELGKDLESSDIITLSAIYRKGVKEEEWKHSQSQNQCQIHKAYGAFGLDVLDTASKKLKFPRLIGSYKIEGKFPEQQFLGVTLILSRYKQAGFDDKLPEVKRQHSAVMRYYYDVRIPITT